MRYAALAPRALGASALPAPERYGHLSGSSVEGIFFRHVYEGRANISCSFDPRTLLCHVCEGGVHSILHSDEGLMPKLFVLSDQLFPPKMAARGVGLACGAVIRVEDGSPRELVDTFRKLTEGKNLQVGSVIMICATTHLGRHGTSRYAEDIAAAMAALEDDYKGRVRVVHGLPIPGDDVKDMVVSRSLLDTLMWIGEVDKRKNYHLPDTVKFYTDKVLCNAQAENKSAMATVELPLFLPTTIKGGDKTTFLSSGTANLAAGLPALEPENERELLATMANEFNSNYALNLESAPVTTGQANLMELTGCRASMWWSPAAAMLAGSLTRCASISRMWSTSP
jgi:hypothetical protein